jgi:murein DD-endopeptidase MepM/ murein hydrolase activator NlpD
MQALKALLGLVAILVACFGAGPVATAGPGAEQLTPLVADVLAAPHAVRGSDGRTHLVYEIRIANTTDGRVSLKRIVVLDSRSGTTMAELDAQAIGGRFSLGGRRGSETNELGPSQFGVAFMHVALEQNAPIPAALLHVVEAYAEKVNADFAMRAAATPVVAGDPPVLRPPLRGQGYVAADGCCDSIRHVRALLPLNGRFYLSQRFAIDWERIDDEGRIFRGDPKDVRSYRIYGDAVLAVADATVVAARNDLPDQVPGKLPEGLPIDEADGNFVILDIGGGAYALFAHLRPESVRVTAGDRVRRGDHIGDVGNTGNSQAPHLHFQLMDAPAGLAANGLPYVFDAFAVSAVDEAGTADFDRAEATGTPMTLTARVPPIQLQRSLPLDLSVVDWRN